MEPETLAEHRTEFHLCKGEAGNLGKVAKPGHEE
jgi:hypothetical protein